MLIAWTCIVSGVARLFSLFLSIAFGRESRIAMLVDRPAPMFVLIFTAGDTSAVMHGRTVQHSIPCSSRSQLHTNNICVLIDA